MFVGENADARDDQLGVPQVSGRWRLASWHTISDDGAVAGLPFGEDPQGVLIYTPGGAMAGQVAATSRPSVVGDRIIHYVDTSLIPAWAGM